MILRIFLYGATCFAIKSLICFSLVVVPTRLTTKAIGTCPASSSGYLPEHSCMYSSALSILKFVTTGKSKQTYGTTAASMMSVWDWRRSSSSDGAIWVNHNNTISVDAMELYWTICVTAIPGSLCTWSCPWYGQHKIGSLHCQCSQDLLFSAIHPESSSPCLLLYHPNNLGMLMFHHVRSLLTHSYMRLQQIIMSWYEFENLPWT